MVLDVAPSSDPTSLDYPVRRHHHGYQKACKDTYNRTATAAPRWGEGDWVRVRKPDLPNLSVGNQVAVQNQVDRRWTAYGVIVRVCPNRKYLIRLLSETVVKLLGGTPDPIIAIRQLDSVCYNGNVGQTLLSIGDLIQLAYPTITDKVHRDQMTWIHLQKLLPAEYQRDLIRAGGNAYCERSHRFLMDTVAKLTREEQRKWPRYLSAAVLASNVNTSTATGLSPYECVFGRPAPLPTALRYSTNKKTAQCIAQLADEEIKRCEKEYGCTVVGYISDNEAKMVAKVELGEQQRKEYDRLLSSHLSCREAAAAKLQSPLYNQKVGLGEQHRQGYGRLLSSHLSCQQVELGEQQRQGYGRLLSPIAECEDELEETHLPHPLHTNLPHPLQTHLPHPLHTNLPHPLQTHLPHPLQTNLPHPHPLQTNLRYTHPIQTHLPHPLHTIGALVYVAGYVAAKCATVDSTLGKITSDAKEEPRDERYA
ncbi:hypothetical protein FJT64_004830 [Amphibalanus amphitrite]|uniref:Uncharacterized protein n=1 Tax=Amphibalanus amphitrite TaxID=1232801 RepID=A0A6A4VXZ3_AMPAM|nr:hypothetical protein FJT64_004830 [Amphibalanus amphitrite]